MNRRNRKQVRVFQQALIRLGYDLPRYGADGWLGSETVSSAVEYVVERGLTTRWQDGVDWEAKRYLPDDLVQLVIAEAARVPDPEEDDIAPPCWEITDYTTEAAAKRRRAGRRARTVRPIEEVTGITLHQTACVLGEKPRLSLNVQGYASRIGSVFLYNDVQARCGQAQRVFNAHDVGLEMDGYYAGVAGDLSTFWKPKSRPNRKPMEPTEALIQGARKWCRYVVEEVAKRGGRIKWVHAHRQTAQSRISDCGELLWKAVGLWCQEELGLSDGGDRYYVKYWSNSRKRYTQGRPIPVEWDPKRRYKYRYRPKEPAPALAA